MIVHITPTTLFRAHVKFTGKTSPRQHLCCRRRRRTLINTAEHWLTQVWPAATVTGCWTGGGEMRLRTMTQSGWSSVCERRWSHTSCGRGERGAVSFRAVTSAWSVPVSFQAQWNTHWQMFKDTTHTHVHYPRCCVSDDTYLLHYPVPAGFLQVFWESFCCQLFLKTFSIFFLCVSMWLFSYFVKGEEVEVCLLTMLTREKPAVLIIWAILCGNDHKKRRRHMVTQVAWKTLEFCFAVLQKENDLWGYYIVNWLWPTLWLHLPLSWCATASSHKLNSKYIVFCHFVQTDKGTCADLGELGLWLCFNCTRAKVCDKSEIHLSQKLGSNWNAPASFYFPSLIFSTLLKRALTFLKTVEKPCLHFYCLSSDFLPLENMYFIIRKKYYT